MASNLQNPPSPLANIISGTRLGNAASGNVSYTGVGFKPSRIIFLARDSNNFGSIGHSSNAVLAVMAGAANVLMLTGYCMYLYDGAVNYQRAVVLTLDSDGFTLTWTLGGAGIGAVEFDAICMR